MMVYVQLVCHIICDAFSLDSYLIRTSKIIKRFK